MVRATWRRLALDSATVARLIELARENRANAPVRRHALGALLTAQAADSATVMAALASPDEQLRRLAVTGLPRLSVAARAAGLPRAMTDPAAMVRLEALRTWAKNEGPVGCGRLATAVADPNLSVALMALDLLGECPGDSASVRVLTSAMTPLPGETWHRGAHTLVSLAQVVPQRARALLPSASASPVWQVRMYSARAATPLGDEALLRHLAADSVPNVREAAVSGLVKVLGHRADAVYREALGSRDHQLVLTAAGALAGSPARGEAVAALRAALARISEERSETSRDPRIAILVRLRELGTPADSAALLPALEDFDAAVADSAAAILAAWTGASHRASPRPLPADPISRAEAETLRGGRLRFTMAAGGSFEVELLVDAAPLSVARIVRLVRRGYYDGLTFHRVVPNFVVQGGSPGANEYAGTYRFMPDELGEPTHARGTLGVSTRGRDTGDAQLFINLVDNPRLDFDYTVWGHIVSGMSRVDAVQEGDVIRRVEFRRTKPAGEP
jgi:cyclophilin family peptidyl-prolyl cis-trans isomerase/HEAT repeat protein